MFSRIAFAFVVLFATQAHALSMNDVSVLFPVPDPGTELTQLVSPGGDPQFFPMDLLKAAPAIVFKRPVEDLYYRDLRLVGVRIDPCFAEGHGPVACRKQIRMIWQPFEQVRGQWIVDDAGVHTFYDFDDATWAQLVRDWRALPTTTDANAALQINPTLVREGLRGPYAQALKRLIANYCTPDRLTRLTVATINWAGTVWGFAGFDIVDGEAVPMQIPLLNGATRETFNTDISETIEFFGSVNPEPQGLEAWNKIVKHSVAARATMSEADLHAGLGFAYAFENPAMSNPGTVDCVSCHVAQPVRLWGEANFARWTSSFAPVKFVSPLNLKNTSTTPFMTSHVRAFGYAADEVVIAQRTINETAHVVEALNGAP